MNFTALIYKFHINTIAKVSKNSLVNSVFEIYSSKLKVSAAEKVIFSRRGEIPLLPREIKDQNPLTVLWYGTGPEEHGGTQEHIPDFWITISDAPPIFSTNLATDLMGAFPLFDTFLWPCGIACLPVQKF